MQLRRFATLGLAILAPMSLSGCLLLPGEFTSEMTVMKSGEFTFSYNGQIQLVGLANLLNNGLDGELGLEAEFEAACYGDAPSDEAAAKKKGAEKKEKARAKAIAESAATEAAIAKITGSESGTAASRTGIEDSTLSQEAEKPADTAESTDAAQGAADAAAAAVDAAAAAAAAEAAGDAGVAVAADEEFDDGFQTRECTTEEIAEQRKTWDEEQVRRKKEKDQAKKMFAMMLGGIDPEDPKTITRFTKEVERLAAWNKVEHLGNGVFKVDYRTKGRLADDFAFPVIPRYALGNPMVHVTRWDNGRVRIEAPTFHNDTEISAAALMGGGSFLPGMPGGGKQKFDPIEIKGSFTIRTDSPILANNSEEGPVDEAGLQVLRWDIGPKTYGPPMALIRLNN
jgi:hypothetical protein